MHDRIDRRPLIVAGSLMGVGLGGFVDGILFHQVLQWHGMLTSVYPKVGVDPQTALVNTQINMFWDGLFHTFTWLVTVLALILLWRAGRRRDVPWSARTYFGCLPLGWGAFNLVEGLVDHQALGVHHVVEGPGHLPWDVGFLVSGLVLIVIGLMITRAGARDLEARHATGGADDARRVGGDSRDRGDRRPLRDGGIDPAEV